jgi:hypothetical protein
MIESLKQRGQQRRIDSAPPAQSKPGLQWSGESGIKEIVLHRKALTEQNLARIRAQNRAFLLPAQPQLTKDNSVLLASGLKDWPVNPKFQKKSAQNLR